ncbi:MAG: response regulator, partial [Bacteroidetes bacterium]|nr:response regulator [Bacteroidota bacterium]
ALVKELVQLMGGSIQVSSEPEKGTTFALTLPVEATEAKRGVEELELPERKEQTGDARRVQRPMNVNDQDGKPRILVVEDNTDLRGFIIDSLGGDFSYLEGENGREGLQKANEEVPDIIISDVMMPEMDGIEMTERIKGDIRTSHIPLILLTAKSSEESKITGLERGADDYLTKPFNRQELLLKVRNSIKRQDRIRERMRAELMSEAPKVEVLSADEQFLVKVKEEILRQMGDEQLSVESLADDIGMSRVQLYRKVSALTGMSVNEMIRKLRLQRAAQLLQQQWGPVSQVAYEVGFSNLSYFSKVFKEEFGVQPSEYFSQ